MAKRKKQESGSDERLPPVAASRTTDIFARRNRGLLFDVLIFLANIFLMQILVRLFLLIFREAAAGDFWAKAELLSFYAGMLVLPSLAAVLKRWHFHQRIKRAGEKEAVGGWLPFGCIFLPFLYLVVIMWITLAVALTFLDLFPDSELGRTGSGVLLGVGLAYNVVQTVLVFRYFSPPKHKPKSAFLRSPRSEILGDLCIFLNMLLYQVLLNWGAMTYPGFHEGKFVDRFIPLVFFALLMYLTGRIFYLVEDVRHPRTFLTILLANSPIFIRAVLAGGPAR
jgi:hypothetical protein